MKELPDVYQTFSVTDLQTVAKKYMTKDRLFRFVTIPQKAAAKQTAKPARTAR